MTDFSFLSACVNKLKDTRGAASLEAALVIPLVVLIIAVAYGSASHLRSQNTLNRETASLADMLANAKVAPENELSEQETAQLQANLALELLQRGFHSTAEPVQAGVIISIFDTSNKDTAGQTVLFTARAGLDCLEEKDAETAPDLAASAFDPEHPLIIDPLVATRLIRVQTCVKPVYSVHSDVLSVPETLHSQFTSQKTVIAQ